jgi:hypothetical protein
MVRFNFLIASFYVEKIMKKLFTVSRCNGLSAVITDYFFSHNFSKAKNYIVFFIETIVI